MLALVAAGGVCGSVGRAEAQKVGKHRSTQDGWWLTIGPVATAVRIEDTWNSAVGAEVSVLRLRRESRLSLLGGDMGFVTFAQREGARLWFEAEGALGFGPSTHVGLGLGGTVEVDQVRPPRWGVQGTIWFFAGVVPYVRAGVIETTGTFFEAGLMIKLPVKIRY